MNGLGRVRSQGHTLTRLATTALFVVAGTLVVGVPPASAVAQCNYDGNTRSLSVVLSANDPSVNVYADGGNLAVSSVPCASLTEVNSVTINTSARPDVQLYFNLGGGSLGPGFLDEGNGSSEIEFTVTGMGPATVLGVYGSAGNDHITFGQFTNNTTGVTTGQINLNAAVDGATKDVDVSFTSFPGTIDVFTQAGNDTVSGAGAGVLLTGPIWTPLQLNGAEGANTLTGGSGNDSLVFREESVGEGGDALSGGGGIDTVHASTTGSPANATITLDGLANDGSNCPGAGCNGDNVGLDVERVIGSQSSETIYGNADAQYLAGGSDGNDALYGAGGADHLDCSLGLAQGGAGNDLLVPDLDDCVLKGAKGRDTVSFAGLNKPVVVSLDNIANDGPAGSAINVRSDIETVIGSALSDTIIGSDGKNTIDAGAGGDSLYGMGGGDTLIPGPGVDAAAGGPGLDRLSYTASAGPIVLNAVTQLVAGEGNDTFSSIESYVGSGFADVMDGAGANERLAGGAGPDDIFGAGGNDELVGGEGDDTLDGGSGTDTCAQGAGAGSIVNCEA